MITCRKKIAAVQTAFILEALSISQPTKYSASKGACLGTAAILDFYYYYPSVSSPQNRVLLTKSLSFQDRCFMGYKCAPGVTIFISFFGHLLHLFNVRKGTINSARLFNLCAFDVEFNYAPFHSARTFKLGFVCVIMGVPISFITLY